MKKLILLSVSIFFLLACEKDDPKNCCTVVDIGVSIKYINENEENLFQTENALNISDIKVFHKVDSEWEEYFEGNLDNPKGLSELEINGEKFLGISTSIRTDSNHISETKLSFSENDEAIIKTEISKNANNTLVEKVWYNGSLKWEREDNVPRRFTIVK
jgi:hypothetical protein